MVSRTPIGKLQTEYMLGHFWAFKKLYGPCIKEFNTNYILKGFFFEEAHVFFILKNKNSITGYVRSFKKELRSVQTVFLVW